MQPPFEFEDNRHDYPPAARLIRPAFAKCVESVTFFANRKRRRRRKRKTFAIARKAGQKRRQPKNNRNESSLQRTAIAVAGC